MVIKTFTGIYLYEYTKTIKRMDLGFVRGERYPNMHVL